jgi:hypothetical protein
MENIHRVKQATMAWLRVKIQHDAQDLIDIEVLSCRQSMTQMEEDTIQLK